MADDQTHLEHLATLRSALVAKRREVAIECTQFRKNSAGQHFKPSDGSGFGERLLELQEQIHAVDDAIEDEIRLAAEAERSQADAAPPYTPPLTSQSGRSIA
ncbi:hypothetical protein [Methylobacterium sp. J-090]|uniref:hypothetical protein n=1 Tax=Methylobacterium sp. J-090 TaxID=2836666 RepID=UPI001FBB1023|nr:hypothetical protein [Methylobacterium sp. J-090]MCJ2082758.1 hypothetical protein [Methylobacterium sp. J-090]